MIIESDDTVYPHHLHLTNKTNIREVIIQLELQTGPGTRQGSSSKDSKVSIQDERQKSQPIPNEVLDRLREFQQSYLREADGWNSLRDEKAKEIAKSESQNRTQTETIQKLTEALNSERIKRHKSEHTLKQILGNLDVFIEMSDAEREKFVADSEEIGEDDVKVDGKDATEDSENEKAEKVAKQEYVYQGEIESLKSELSQLKNQLEIEEDKVSKLQQIVAEYHQEKVKQEKNAEVMLEQRSQTGARSLASRHSSAPIVKSLGTGDDFFEEMFNEPKLLTLSSQMLLSNGFVTSSIGNIKIDNVHKEGKFIVIRNSSVDKDEELGMYILQQKLHGKVVASFRFPQRAKMRPGSKINIWASSATESRHLPPYDYIWKEQYRCAYGLECITVLCKPNGQAIAWYCAQHHYDGNLPELNDLEQLRRQNRLIPLTESQISEKQTRREFIRREQTEPLLKGNDRKHPHGFHFHMPPHPSSDTFREKTLGNDQTSVVRQMRLGRTPDIVPELYTGGARTGAKILYGFNALERGHTALVPLKSSAGMIRKVSAAAAIAAE